MSPFKEFKERLSDAIADEKTRRIESGGEKLTHKRFADEMGVSLSSIAKWMNASNNMSWDNCQKAARILHCDPRWLYEGVRGADKTKKSETLPLFEIAALTKKQPKPSAQLPKIDDLSDNAFAIKIEGVSMEPEFQIGETIFIDPADAPAIGNYVLAKQKNARKTEVFLRRYISENGAKCLFAENESWTPRTIPIDESIQILGVVRGKYVRFRKT
jgi:SOS-response transcriptional repressor LexA